MSHQWRLIVLFSKKFVWPLGSPENGYTCRISSFIQPSAFGKRKLNSPLSDDSPACIRLPVRNFHSLLASKIAVSLMFHVSDSICERLCFLGGATRSNKVRLPRALFSSCVSKRKKSTSLFHNKLILSAESLEPTKNDWLYFLFSFSSSDCCQAPKRVLRTSCALQSYQCASKNWRRSSKVDFKPRTQQLLWPSNAGTITARWWRQWGLNF